jgi:hypothetical protein
MCSSHKDNIFDVYPKFKEQLPHSPDCWVRIICVAIDPNNCNGIFADEVHITETACNKHDVYSYAMKQSVDGIVLKNPVVTEQVSGEDFYMSYQLVVNENAETTKFCMVYDVSPLASGNEHLKRIRRVTPPLQNK